jgi:hypothetical protein
MNTLSLDCSRVSTSEVHHFLTLVRENQLHVRKVDISGKYHGQCGHARHKLERYFTIEIQMRVVVSQSVKCIKRDTTLRVNQILENVSNYEVLYHRSQTLHYAPFCVRQLKVRMWEIMKK